MLSPCLGSGTFGSPLGGRGTLALCRGGIGGLSAAASASKVVTRIGRWVGIFIPAPGRLPILLIEASASILPANTGPILRVPSVPTPASL
jgi:hypothetical protein